MRLEPHEHILIFPGESDSPGAPQRHKGATARRGGLVINESTSGGRGNLTCLCLPSAGCRQF